MSQDPDDSPYLLVASELLAAIFTNLGDAGFEFMDSQAGSDSSDRIERGKDHIAKCVKSTGYFFTEEEIDSLSRAIFGSVKD